MALASWFLGSQLLQENHSSAYIKPSHRLNGIHSMQTFGSWCMVFSFLLHTSSHILPISSTVSSCYHWASHVMLVVKNTSAHAGDIRNAGSITGSGRSFRGGHGNPLQYSGLENPHEQRSLAATVHRVAESQTLLKRLIMRALRISHNSISKTNFSLWLL